VQTWIALLLLSLATGAAFGGVEDVKTPRGESVRLLVEKGSDSWVTVVLFAGGHGVLGITEDGALRDLGGNFLVRSRSRFVYFGAVAAVIDAPSDNSNSLHGFRDSPEHAEDVGAVIRHLKAKYRLPVWLVGTSRGTNSVANAAVRLGADSADGIVLTASMLSAPRRGTQVLAMNLEKVRLPVLIAHHREDACDVTPPGGVEALRRRLTQAAPVKVLWFEGGSGIRGNPCQARHYHGFAGIEQEVVAAIMRWIKSPAP